MSLQEAMLSIADEMEKDSHDPDISETFLRASLRNFARLIRISLKASETPPAAPKAQQGEISIFEHRGMVDKYRDEFRKDMKKSSVMLESLDDKLSLAVDGPNQGDYLPINQKMTVGAKTTIDGSNVYKLGEDGNLHFDGILK